MDSGLLLAFGIGFAGVIAAVIVSLTRNWQRRFELFAYQSDLRVSDEIITAAVIRRLRRTDLGSAVGAAVGLIVSASLVGIARPAGVSAFLWAAILPLMLLFVTAGAVASSLTDELFSPVHRSPRVARPTAVSIRDYISPGQFWLVPVVVVAAVVLTLVGVVLSSFGVLDPARFLQGSTIWATPVAVVVTLGGFVVARLIVAQKQPASDSLELAWSDALRADTFRMLWVFESIMAWLAVVLAGIGILRALPVPIGASWAGLILTLAGNFGILAMSRVFNYGAGRSYFRYRLWPSLGDVGEIVDDSDEDSVDAAADAEIEERRS